MGGFGGRPRWIYTAQCRKLRKDVIHNHSTQIIKIIRINIPSNFLCTERYLKHFHLRSRISLKIKC